MSPTRKTVIAAVAALTLAGSMIGSTAPADAHDYTNVGSVTAKEANKMFKQAFKQRCLTVHEAQHIARGSGEEQNYYDEEEGVSVTSLDYVGTGKSHISSLTVVFHDGCATSVDAYKR